MKKRIITFVLAAVMIMCLLTAAASADNAQRAYWHEYKAACTDSYYADWMANIPDTTHINDVSIPGTHDTMAWQGSILLHDIMMTQTMTLQQQLSSGIRYLDMRLCHRGSYFEIHHNFVDTKSSLDNVLDTVQAFFSKHPGETIVMRMQQEYGNETADQMNELLSVYYDRYGDLFYSGKSKNPTMAELRGKIFVLYQGLKCVGGTNYYDVDCQDFFELTTNWDLYKKWELVKAQLNNADNSDGSRMYLNHLSGATGSMPYFVASGKASPGNNAIQLSTGLVVSKSCNKYPDFPRKNLLFGTQEIDFMGTNQLTADYINANGLRNVGIIAADFPGEALIRAVIDCNFR